MIEEGRGYQIVRELDIEVLRLDSGAHSADSERMCVMEAVAYLAGEPWSDSSCNAPLR
jgi:hypothetical protein